eukprot:359186-Chlamydomonas_euryale.AAC.1
MHGHRTASMCTLHPAPHLANMASSSTSTTPGSAAAPPAAAAFNSATACSYGEPSGRVCGSDMARGLGRGGCAGRTASAGRPERKSRPLVRSAVRKKGPRVMPDVCGPNLRLHHRRCDETIPHDARRDRTCRHPARPLSALSCRIRRGFRRSTGYADEARWQRLFKSARLPLSWPVVGMSLHGCALSWCLARSYDIRHPNVSDHWPRALHKPPGGP